MMKRSKPSLPVWRGGVLNHPPDDEQLTGAIDPARTASHFLQPGELFADRKGAMIGTVLGSCVAITMYSPRCRMGAVCHSMLPSCRQGRQGCDECQDGFRYVDCSIRRMLRWFASQNIHHSEIEVKLFGGSEMFTGNPAKKIRGGVGRQNIEMAFQVLAQDGLAPVVTNLGGCRGRKIYFKSDTGEVFLKKLRAPLLPLTGIALPAGPAVSERK